MTLIIVGNVDARSVAEQINKTFGELKENAKRLRQYPRSPLRAEAVSIMTDAVRGIACLLCGICRGSPSVNLPRCYVTGALI